MILQRLVLSQFRCWSYYECRLPESLVYLQGANGSGKTSLLEAIGLLSNGRSFLTHRTRECIQHDQNQFSIRGEFTDAPVDTVSLRYEKSQRGYRRLVKVDGESLERLSELQDTIATLYFCASDLLTLREGPSRRRRLLNEVLSRTESNYIPQLKQYETARKQRNSTLKSNTPDPQLLESLEETMASTGQRLMAMREKWFPRVEPKLSKEHRQLIEDPPRTLRLRYCPDVETPDSFLARLREERSTAIRRGYTTIGPQRDDWSLLMDGRPAGTYASRGELRTLVFALKFAVAADIMEQTEQWPILLFDDMVSDLDNQRIKRALERASERPFQLIFSGTRPLVEEGVLSDEHRISVRGEES